MRFANTDGFYELNPFPHCNQLVVMNHVLIYQENRGKGVGTNQNKLIIKKAKLLGFDYLMCTVVATNTAQLKIMEKNGFKELDEFLNKETGNTVKIFGKKL